MAKYFEMPLFTEKDGTVGDCDIPTLISLVIWCHSPPPDQPPVFSLSKPPNFNFLGGSFPVRFLKFSSCSSYQSRFCLLTGNRFLTAAASSKDSHKIIVKTKRLCGFEFSFQWWVSSRLRFHKRQKQLSALLR